MLNNNCLRVIYNVSGAQVCALKPENILLCHSKSNGIKIIFNTSDTLTNPSAHIWGAISSSTS